MGKLAFTKLHGAGNDYLFVEQVAANCSDPAELTRRISDRRTGVGSDGLIFVEPSQVADAKMRMFNADGSEGVMCGNGLRCLAKFLFDRRRVGAEMRLEAAAGVVPAQVTSQDSAGRASQVCLELPSPSFERSDIPMIGPPGPVLGERHRVGDRELELHGVSVGNPHCVVFVPDPESFPVLPIGRAIQEGPWFPDQANVEFVALDSDGALRQRTVERGSGETLACGSGAVAAAAVAMVTGRIEAEEVAVRLRGGELSVAWEGPGSRVRLTGPAVEVFAGEYAEPSAAFAVSSL